MAAKSRSGSPVGLAAAMPEFMRSIACIICDANVESAELSCPEVVSSWWTLCANAMPAMDVTNIEVRRILRRMPSSG